MLSQLWLVANKIVPEKRRVLTEEKLDEIGARLEHGPWKSPRRLAQDRYLEIVSNLATKPHKLRPREFQLI
jgi:hypothetical protein